MRFPYFRPNKATLVAENSQTNVINDINKAAGGTDRQIAGGVCAAMCAKWIEAGTRNANFWGSLSEEEVLSDIKWIQHREMSFQRQIAMVTGVPIERGVVDPAKRAEGYARVAQLPDTDPQVGRLVDVMERKQTWQSDLICERTGLECETKFAHRTGEDAGRVPSDIAKGPPGYFVLHTMFERGGHIVADQGGVDLLTGQFPAGQASAL